MKRKLKNKKGFTLVELVVVIAIIAILAAVLIPVIGSYVGDATNNSREENTTMVMDSIKIELAEMQKAGAALSFIPAGSDSAVMTVMVSDSGVSVDPGTSLLADETGSYKTQTFTNNLGVRLKEAMAGEYTCTFQNLNGAEVLVSVDFTPAN